MPACAGMTVAKLTGQQLCWIEICWIEICYCPAPLIDTSCSPPRLTVTIRVSTRKGSKMISALYASLLAFLICWLSLNVIKKRRINKISIGDGDNEELKTAMAAQSNAIEYIPIALLLLLVLEYNNSNLLFVHALGLSLIAGRILHARGILSGNLKTRILGMQVTIFTIIGLAVINIIYLPYAKLFNP
jgi:uncharacterized membrane protein YecN with MAPEG domain